ncbi:MAG: pantetheine-phosphate adenylyltransferase [Rickettsiales bacterium]|jgi:pantetheine-phosphate adenylyltransferase
MTKNIAIYPGSFDPITLGHIDIIKRASKIFDHVILAIARDNTKSSFFSMEKKLSMAQNVLEDLKNVEVSDFSGLLVNFAKKRKAKIAIRGLRAISDFEYEFQIYNMNSKLDPNLQTIFLPSSTELQFISSKLVKEVARLGGNVSSFVSPIVEKELKEAFL